MDGWWWRWSGEIKKTDIGLDTEAEVSWWWMCDEGSSLVKRKKNWWKGEVKTCTVDGNWNKHELLTLTLHWFWIWDWLELERCEAGFWDVVWIRMTGEVCPFVWMISEWGTKFCVTSEFGISLPFGLIRIVGRKLQIWMKSLGKWFNVMKLWMSMRVAMLV